MSNGGDRFPVEIHFFDDEERDEALEALADVFAESSTEYDGFVEGKVTVDALPHLKGLGLQIEFPAGIPEAAKHSGPSAPSPALAADSLLPAQEAFLRENAFQEFAQRSRHLDIEHAAGHKVFRLRASPRTEHDPILDGLVREESGGEDFPDAKHRLPEDFYVLSIDGPMRPEWRKSLTDLGLEISSFEPPNRLTVRASSEQVDVAAALDFVVSVKRYGLLDSISRSLQEVLQGEGAVGVSLEAKAEWPRRFQAVLHRREDLDEIRAVIESSLEEPDVEACGNVVQFSCDLDSPFLSGLARQPAVRKIHPYEPPRLFCDVARVLVGADPAGPSSMGVPWDGKDQVVAVLDSGIDAQHPDFEGRIVAQLALSGAVRDDRAGHGTHVAGILAGDGKASNGRVRGMAPAAKIVSVGVTDDQGRPVFGPYIVRAVKLAVDSGAKILNMSWGLKLASDYNQFSAALDEFLYQNPDVLAVVAAGNEGETLHQQPNPGEIRFKTIGSPASAKNVVTVGASASDRGNPPDPSETWGKRNPQSFPHPPVRDQLVVGPGLADALAALSSRGPTDNQAVKPDVVAPGTYILAARAANASMAFPPTPLDFGGRYGFLTGTSMATPVVSGLAALVRQYLVEERGIASPPSSLVKAVLIAATRRLPARQNAQIARAVGYPDFDQGWGRVVLTDVLRGRPAGGFHPLAFDSIANDAPEALESRQPIGSARTSSRNYKVKVGDGAPLKVVLCWLDPPGNGLQNNLDLHVRAPNGDRLVGNSEHRFHRRDELLEALDLGTVSDQHNTVEAVVFDAPESGTYRVKVTAKTTPLTAQGFSLVALGDLQGDLEFNF